MSLEEMIRAKVQQNTMLAIVGGNHSSMIMDAVKGSGKKSMRLYDFTRINLCGDLPEFESGGNDLLIIHRIDQAPPSFLMAFFDAVRDKALLGISVVISAVRNLGIPSSIQDEFMVIRAAQGGRKR